MAYISGTVSSFADLKTALYNACTANGWTLSNDIISKSGCFFKLTSTTLNLSIDAGTSQSGSTLTGNKPRGQAQLRSFSSIAMVFPINYEIFLTTSPNEILCVINYNSDFYQHLWFGISDVPDIGGTGAFFSANNSSGAEIILGAIRWQVAKSDIRTSPVSNTMALGMFSEGTWATNSNFASFVNCGLDSATWCDVWGTYPHKLHSASGMSNVASLLTALPNLLNAANILLPVKAVKQRGSGGITTVLNLRNARFCRIDAITPGESIFYGTDEWKFYPIYRKNFAVRNGLPKVNEYHTGTFGVAYRVNA